MLTNMKKPALISLIHGLVTRGSSNKRIPLKPLRCAGLYKTEGACVSSPEVVTKPSPYTLGAFCLAISEFTRTPHDSSGPTWGAWSGNIGIGTPPTRRAAFLSGTAQDTGFMVKQGPCRLNDFLKGLWTNRRERAEGVVLSPLLLLFVNQKGIKNDSF